MKYQQGKDVKNFSKSNGNSSSLGMKRSESVDRLISGMEKFAVENKINLIKNKSDKNCQGDLVSDEVVTQIACGTLHTLVLTSHGRVFSSGFGESYALGHGNDISLSVFTEISCFTSASSNRNSIQLKQVNQSILSSDEYVEFIASGLIHSLCFTNKRRIFAWGIISDDLENIFKYPQEIILEDINNQKDTHLSKIVDIKCGQSLTLILTKGGNLYGLGKQHGELAQKQTVPGNIARRIQNIPSVSKIAASSNHYLIYSSEKKRIYGWGDNSCGQLQLSQQTKEFVSHHQEIAVLQNEDKDQYLQIGCGPACTIIISDQLCHVNDLSMPQIHSQIEQAQKNEVIHQQQQQQQEQEQQQKVQVDIGQMKSEIEKKRQVLIQRNNELQNEIEQITNANYILLQEEEKTVSQVTKLKQQLTLYQTQLNQTSTQIQSTPAVKIDQNIKFKISNSEKFKNVVSRTFQPNLEVNYEDLEILNKITEGGYGIIYKAKWREIIVAVKKFKLDYTNPQQIAEFVTECNAMEALRHPNIVLFLGACTQAPNFSIVMEYCQRGSLWSLLQNQRVPLTWEDRRKIALDVAKAVYFLHSAKPPIVHRDLKSLNVLVDDNFRCKLTDFGWTRVKPQDNYMTNKIGTYQWMAPEVVNGFYYTEKADVFSYAIILWEIASREPPYKGIKGDIVANDVFSKNLRPVIPQNTPRFFRSLIEQCWEADPEKRPSFKEITKTLDVMIVE